MQHLMMALTGLLMLLSSLVQARIDFHQTRDLNQPLLESYDYIVVGCGISGLVVTNRLSELSSRTVLCIEAGDADNYEPIIQTPVYVGADVGGIYDWNLVTTPQTQLDGAVRPMPQGKVLGGGSILNAMCWNRGGADDYDAWEALGNPGWGWDGILPYFRKSETYTPVFSEATAEEYSINYNPDVHGTDGPVQVSYPKYFYPQSVNLFAAMNQLGLPTQFDPNDGTSAGPALVPTDIDPVNQTRSDARRTYYDPYAERRNMHVITGQHVTRLIIEGVANNSQVSNPTDGGNENGNGPSNGNNNGFGFGPGGTTPQIQGQTGPGVARRQASQNSDLRVQGVEFAANASAPRRTVYATREVIVAAGALHSAQLLQLSGIGPASLLNQHDIPLALDLPGVGQNLQDHCLVGTFYPYNNASYPSPTELTTNATYNAEAQQEYETQKTGPWTAGSPNALAFNPLSLITHNAWIILMNASMQSPTDYLLPDTDPTIVAGFAAQKNSLVSRYGEDNVAAYEIINNNAGSLTLSVMHPLSRGTCQIISADPFEPPAIDPRWLTNPVDRQVLVEALRFNREILATPPMQELQPAQFVPPVDADEDALNQVINNGIRTEFHPSGTLAMLPLEQGGVVDSHLRVWGTQNLRVVDAGIFPLIPAAHLQAVVYAVAEKAADIIKEDNLPASAVSTSIASTASSVLSSTAIASMGLNSSRTNVSVSAMSLLFNVIETSSPIASSSHKVHVPRSTSNEATTLAETTLNPQTTTLPATGAITDAPTSTGASITALAPSVELTSKIHVALQSTPTFAPSVDTTSASSASVIVFTTTLPPYLPSYLSSIQVHTRRSHAVSARTTATTSPVITQRDSSADMTSSVVNVLSSVGLPPSAVTSLASMIVHPRSGSNDGYHGQSTDIARLQQVAAMDAVLGWIVRFFES